MTDNIIQQAAEAIDSSQTITAFTGAGISKESGISTYREPQEGEWAKHNPMMLATSLGFTLNPKLVWRWNMHRREIILNSQPNPAHHALTDLQSIKPSLTIITQNIDDLHERANTQHITHLHGSLLEFKCSGDCEGNPTLVDLDEINYIYVKDDLPPKCAYCEFRFIRPNVVWFGEALPVPAVQTSRETMNKTDVLLVVGLSGAITYGAPNVVKDNGGIVIEINPAKSAVTDLADFWIQAPAGKALPELIEAIRGLTKNE